MATLGKPKRKLETGCNEGCEEEVDQKEKKRDSPFNTIFADGYCKEVMPVAAPFTNQSNVHTLSGGQQY
jgi:hypothetical protein